ncbi:hypothetical protein SAY86_005525 [Trapa natans]|uniref:Uncharacterized protein n=1 Tax=Trapa natans TaxID=22666 RepID=A0AAN7QSK2_TRANT|nr:hypothetical protein SAY86_005525 [Trapa natans]
MGFFSKEERSRKLLRVVKTVFVLITILVSLLFSAPILLVIADTLLPSALLSASLPLASGSLKSLSAHFTSYDFRYSPVDIPLIPVGPKEISEVVVEDLTRALNYGRRYNINLEGAISYHFRKPQTIGAPTSRPTDLHPAPIWSSSYVKTSLRFVGV